MTDDNQPPAGWYTDPIARFSERYWDGSAWTARVRDGLVEVIDEQWASAGTSAASEVPGSANQGQAISAQTVTVSGPLAPAGFDRDDLAGELVRPRPLPRVQEALAAAGGAIAVFGLIFLVVWMMVGDATQTSGRAEAAVIGFVLLATAYAWAILGPRESRSAALIGAIVGPSVLVAAMFGTDDGGSTELIAAAISLSVVWALMFFGPGFTGAPVLLAASLLAAWGAVIAIAASTSSDDYYYGYDEPLFNSPLDLGTSVGIISLFFAFGCVIAAGVADARGARVLATPLLAVAVVQSWVGVGTASGASQTAAGVLALLVGIAFTLVGSFGRRRGSLWFGAVLIAMGILSLVLRLGQEFLGVAILALAAGVGLVAAAPVIDRAIASRQADASTTPGEGT